MGTESLKRFNSRYILALMAFGFAAAAAGWTVYVFSEDVRLRNLSDAKLFAQCDPETDACELAICAGIWDARYQIASEQGAILDFEATPDQLMGLAIPLRRDMALDSLWEVRRRSHIQQYTFGTDESTRDISDHNMHRVECGRAVERNDIDRIKRAFEKTAP